MKPVPRNLVDPRSLGAVDALILDAVVIEHEQSTARMAATLRNIGWSEENASYVATEWPWTDLAKAVVRERMVRGLAPTDPQIVSRLHQNNHPQRAARADQEWVRDEREPRDLLPGEVISLPPRPVSAAPQKPGWEVLHDCRTELVAALREAPGPVVLQGDYARLPDLDADNYQVAEGEAEGGGRLLLAVRDPQTREWVRASAPEAEAAAVAGPLPGLPVRPYRAR